jgi:hypothetical protein
VALASEMAHGTLAVSIQPQLSDTSESASDSDALVSGSDLPSSAQPPPWLKRSAHFTCGDSGHSGRESIRVRESLRGGATPIGSPSACVNRYQPVSTRTSTADPMRQVATGAPRGSTALPKSPCAMVEPFSETDSKTALPGPANCGVVPPAIPHASSTGALPGARQGWNL